MVRILNTWSDADRAYMQEAIALAERGRGHTAPNPMVGCVLVKDGRTIGRGYHHRYGDLHAERDALAACTEDPAGATMYVTLEPCCHHGKQPPCTDAILAAGIARVVVGATDPNPLVGGKGIALLRAGGVAVEAGLLEEENGWCWYVMCLDCGAQTAHFEYKTPGGRAEAARNAAHIWNIGKVVRGDIGE